MAGATELQDNELQDTELQDNVLQDSEGARLAALRRYGVLDTPAEESFDRVARVAAGLFRVPVALIGFLDASRVWYKAAFGLSLPELERRDDALCAAAALSNGVLVVPDASRDARFRSSPIVAGAPGVRFYAGAPLALPGGPSLGALCVLDTEPRLGLTPGERGALADLAAMVVSELELRYADRARRESEEKYRNLFHESPIGIFRTSPDGRILLANPALLAMHGVSSLEELANFDLESQGYGEGYSRAEFKAQLEAHGEIRGNEVAWLRPDGSHFYVRQNARVVRGVGGEVYYEGTVENITDRKEAERALQASVSRFRALVQNSSDVVTLLSAEGTVLYESGSVEGVLGYSPEELVGRTPYAYVHPDDRAAVAEGLGRCIADGEAVTVVYRFHHADGSWRWLESTGVNRLADAELAAVVVNSRDVTEQVEAQRRIGQQTAELQALNLELNKRLSRLTALHRIDLAITSNVEQRAVLDVILEQVVGQLGVDAAAVLTYHAEAQTLEYAAARGLRPGSWRQLKQRLGEGLAGLAALEQRLVHRPDLGRAERAGAGFPELLPEDLTAYWAVPLVTKGKIQGVLELFQRSPRPPEADWQDFLETLAGQAALTIESAHLFSDLQRSNMRLRVAYDTTIEGWARALDLKDEETAGHSQRVTEMTVRLARHMGMCEEEVVHLRRGALLHDIGKMGVPDQILLKPGKLTEEEWEAMKAHTTYAYELLSPIAFLVPALDIPYCHHERWDGGGYPRGLKELEIPLAARIFAVVDVWDALSSDRPYRRAWPEGEVMRYLEEQSGRHFDPRVVAAFFELLES